MDGDWWGCLSRGGLICDGDEACIHFPDHLFKHFRRGEIGERDQYISKD